LSYDELDRLDDARKALERALALKEAELGRDHPSIAISLMNLASIERRAGKLDVADALWQRAYDIRVAAFGAQHPDVTKTLQSRTTDLAARGGNDADALTMARDVVARLRGQTDTMSLGIGIALLAELERRAGTDAAVTRAAEEAAKVLRATPDPNRDVLGWSYLARAARTTARGRELLELARTALGNATRDKRLAAAYVGWAEANVLAAAHQQAEAAATAAKARDGFTTESGAAYKFYIDELDRLTR
jgi:hypothetical protein